jgi:hypothetical protein
MDKEGGGCASTSATASPSARARGQEGGRSCASSSVREQAIWDSEGGHVASSSARAIREEGGGPTFSSTQCVFLQLQGITSEGQVVGVRQQQEDIGAPSPCHNDTNQDRNNSSLTDLCSPSSLAARLGLIATPQREAYISSLLSNEKCSLTFNKVIEPAYCSLNFVVTPSMLSQTPTPDWLLCHCLLCRPRPSSGAYHHPAPCIIVVRSWRLFSAGTFLRNTVAFTFVHRRFK